MHSRKPRIGIIGSGAIGGFYGLMLLRAGFDVHFLLRSEYDVVRQQGLRLDSAVHGEVRMEVQAYADVAHMPQCDWLLVGAKATSNLELAPLIMQAAAPGARVVLLQNGLGVETQLRPALRDDLHLLGGLCFICVNRQAPGLIRHQALGAVHLGYHSGPATDGGEAIVEEGAGLFRTAGIDSKAMSNLDQARWQKLVWNVPYNGLSVLLRASTTPLMADADSRALIQALMAEVVLGAKACGHALPEGYAEQLFRMTEQMPDYWPSMYHDFAQHRPLELQAIYAEPLAQAHAAGCRLPNMEMLYKALAFIDRDSRRT
ncbi:MULTISPECIES: putative 2-dehydropantoate 2-reductase [Pseudomonas]|uniref:2-dehydropantoate 2-reductase n=1 Tax=Pseudomonas taiwanensis TaxID=470150 RepID=A0ABR6V868_9PSED|nr:MULTISPECIES: putative 2-dehydropantoate 2-reductase [Pseudomonas]AGZ34467.1 2-dehydropantoate 2-reductase [Pseudomonas sp. VLB120]MBC3476656.1 putative 2-dehydropantoate 2-reductase [Pseudomonas taiwanensis]MBC3493560.1 putative 2-dehydropantoate 2-reductase [Pseudomonas taiwanensis]MDT8921665.1 putative 2-dehydropantoate 2-reductase [Pseudomonas taiwanensis]MPT00471.1 putative 2-dehydropantoate 2-reductase [Pseudomonas sp.]